MTIHRHVALLFVGLVVCACGDDRPPASSGTASTPAPDGGGKVSGVDAGDGGPDASVITPRPDLCEGLTLDGDRVPEIEYFDDPPPPLGGEVEAGAYELKEVALYAGADARPLDGGSGGSPTARLTGRDAAAVMIVTEFEMRTIEASGDTEAPELGPPASRASLYRVEGTNVLATSVCPTTALPVAVPYSAVGGTLALFPEPNKRLVFRLRP